MKKSLVAVILCFCLLISGLSFAHADTVVDSTLHNWYSAELNEYTNTIMVHERSGVYYLVDKDGNKISQDYADMTQRNTLYRVSDGAHSGIIDGRTGQVLVPCEYDHTDTVDYDSTTWLVGYRLSATGTSDQNDFYSTNYSTGAKTYYMIESTDFYFKGTKVGTLPRSEYTNNSMTTVHGDYLFIKNATGYTAYTPSFASRQTDDGYSSEYSSSNVHQGTGQQAFTPSCTLTADEVERSVLENNNFFYDLQGNLLFTAKSPYSYTSINDKNYARVRMDDRKYGIIDMQGNEIVPPICDEIASDSQYFASGYQAVSVDGKIGFYNAKGELTCPFVYGYSSASPRGAFASLKDLTGGYIVLSGAMGELPMHFEDVDLNYDSSATCFSGVDSNGNVGIMDVFGNILVPFDGTFTKYTWNLNVSRDGTVILGQNTSKQYVVYQVEKGNSTVGTVQDQHDDGTWNCPNCGQEGNTSKFCPSCGTQKPEAAAQQVCSSCGYILDEGETAIFCPNCGTKFE